MDPSHHDLRELWQAARRLSILDETLRYLSKKSVDLVLCDLVLSKSSHCLEATDLEWSVSEHRESVSAIQSSASECIISFAAFMGRWIEPSLISDFGRRVWGLLVPILSKSWGNCEEAGLLEASLIDMGFLPISTPRTLQERWQSQRSLNEKASTAAVLSNIRDKLSADINHVPVHVNLRGKELALKGTYVPVTVSREAARIVSEYFQRKENAVLIPKILALFILLRKPEMSDPHAVNPRHAALFFNDCTYLCLALAVSGFALEKEIRLLRSEAGRSMIWFLSTVKARAASHLKTSGGLLKNSEIADAEESIYRCFAELNACAKDWLALHIPAEIAGSWMLTLLEAVMKRMTSLSVESARDAVSKSTKAGTVVNSGLWSVHKTFMEEVKSLSLSQADTPHRIAWLITDRIRCALTGSETDIMRLEPLPDDEGLYGISGKGFEAILRCNPILRPESNESWSRLASRLMVQDSSSMDSSTHQSQSNSQEKSFASLFERR